MSPTLAPGCAAAIPAETLRKMETGRIVTPAFFTVAAPPRPLTDLAALADKLGDSDLRLISRSLRQCGAGDGAAVRVSSLRRTS